MMIVDGLSMPVPERRWFAEYHEAKLGAVNTTLCVWENSQEALALIAKWRLALEQNKDIVAQAASDAVFIGGALDGVEFAVGMGDVADMDDQIGLDDLFQSRTESRHQMGRQV